jgi:hypothetical protein
LEAGLVEVVLRFRDSKTVRTFVLFAATVLLLANAAIRDLQQLLGAAEREYFPVPLSQMPRPRMDNA